MKSKRVDDQQGARTFVLVFDKGDEAKAGLTAFARDHEISAAQITWPTLEVVLTAAPRHLRKTHDAETGLALINPQA